MIKRFFPFFILLVIVTSIKAQDNILLDRSFWKTSPSIELIKGKVKEGHDPTAFTPFAFDPMVYALLEHASSDVVKYLLSFDGNEVDKITHDGRNYLLWAVYAGDLATVEYLIEEGSQIDLVDDHGYNALTFAAIGGQDNPKLYDLLLDKGLDIESANHSGATTLLISLPKLKSMKLVDYFVSKGLQLEDRDDEGNNAFHYASRTGNRDIMSALINRGIDPLALNEAGDNAILIACKGARRHTNGLDVYMYLDSLGLSSTHINNDAITALHNLAYSTDDPSIIDYFENKGLSMNTVDKNGNTAFLNAVAGKNNKLINYWINEVDDINHTNDKGQSALTKAISRGDAQSMGLLLLQRADPCLRDHEGKTLMQYAYEADAQASEEDLELILTALRLADCPLSQNESNSLLHLAAEQSSMYLINEALTNGADINAKDEQGLTALHLTAMKTSDFTLLSNLLQKGANTSILTAFGESAYDLASENELLSLNSAQLKLLQPNN